MIRCLPANILLFMICLEAFSGRLNRASIFTGPDGGFFWAKVAIERNTFLVSSKDFLYPFEVCYAWEANPGVNLINTEGLPAVSFRTDNFKLSTQ